MTRSLLAFAALVLAPLIACAQQNDTGYVDVSAYPLTEAQYEAWWTLQGNLRRHFDQLCGDLLRRRFQQYPAAAFPLLGGTAQRPHRHVCLDLRGQQRGD